MHIREKFKHKEETVLVVVGSLLLIISLLLFHYQKILEISDEIYNDIQSKIFMEQTSQNSKLTVSVSVDYLEEVDKNKPSSGSATINYLGFLEIDKISLRQGFLSKDSRYNNVNYHIQVLTPSDYPDVIGGNFIIAGHSGSGSIAYFRNLYKLVLGDTAKVYYNGKLYHYKIVNIYKEAKDGAVNIYRDQEKNTLTLITCTKNDKKTQTIYILELTGVESY